MTELTDLIELAVLADMVEFSWLSYLALTR
jgi:hypothetical protein